LLYYVNFVAVPGSRESRTCAGDSRGHSTRGPRADVTMTDRVDSSTETEDYRECRTELCIPYVPHYVCAVCTVVYNELFSRRNGLKSTRKRTRSCDNRPQRQRCPLPAIHLSRLLRSHRSSLSQNRSTAIFCRSYLFSSRFRRRVSMYYYCLYGNILRTIIITGVIIITKIINNIIIIFYKLYCSHEFNFNITI
jgi:hypothetical protein